MEPNQTENKPIENIETSTQKPNTISLQKKVIFTIFFLIILIAGGSYYYFNQKVSIKETQNIMDIKQNTAQEASVPSEEEKKLAKSALLEIRAILKNKDIEAAKKYFTENGMQNWADIMSGDKDEAIHRLEQLFVLFEPIDEKGLDNKELQWTKEKNKNGRTVIIVDGIKNPNPVEGEIPMACYFSVRDTGARLQWVYQECYSI